MRNRNSKSFLAVFAAVTMLTAVAAAAGAPWPEAHSGAYLGVQVTAITQERASALKLQNSTGAVIAYVDQDGPARHAGLQENDVVVAFDGSKVDGPEQLQKLNTRRSAAEDRYADDHAKRLAQRCESHAGQLERDVARASFRVGQQPGIPGASARLLS